MAVHRIAAGCRGERPCLSLAAFRPPWRLSHYGCCGLPAPLRSLSPRGASVSAACPRGVPVPYCGACPLAGASRWCPRVPVPWQGAGPPTRVPVPLPVRAGCLSLTGVPVPWQGCCLSPRRSAPQRSASRLSRVPVLWRGARRLKVHVPWRGGCPSAECLSRFHPFPLPSLLAG